MPMDSDGGLEGAYELKTPEDNIRYYSGWALTYDSEFAKARGYAAPAAVARAYTKQARPADGPVLDVGCGTGLVAESMPGYVMDGMDISPAMLEGARSKGMYRTLIEADLTHPLPLADHQYSGLVCAGTFTFGHVGPEVLDELLRVMAPGSVGSLGVHAAFFGASAFADKLRQLEEENRLSQPEITEFPMYTTDGLDDAHARDRGMTVVFRRR